MEDQNKRYSITTRVVRWIARIWSIATIGLVLLFIIGEGFNPSFNYELLGFIFFPLGISVGMILAWWREGFGGSITAGSLLTFYIINFASTSNFPKGWAWLVFSIPGFLFLICWYRSRKAKTVDS